jgi:VanZ family protein
MIIWLEKKRGIALLMTLLLAAEIFFFSSICPESITISRISFSTLYHFVVFFLFNFFLFIAIKGDKKITVKYVFIALLISILYSFSDEFHQSFVPNRDSSFRDIMTNSAGIFTSAIIYVSCCIKREKAKSSEQKSS